MRTKQLNLEQKKHIKKLSAELIDKVKSITTHLYNYKKGDVLIKEGEKQKYVYLIEKGEVILIKTGLKNTVEIVNQKDGDLIGVDLIFNEHVSEYSAIAKKNTTFYRLLIDDFKKIMLANSNLSLELMQYINSLISSIENKNATASN